MAKQSKIEWTDHSWNPWIGCLKVSPGCKGCYMYRDQKRYGNDPRAIRRSKTKFGDPLKWHYPAMVFTCSWSDWFIEEADAWRPEAWDIVRQTPQLTYQILTKRPERIEEHLPNDWGDGWPNVWLGVSVENDDYLHRLNILSQIPASVRFVSYEPALGPINLIPWLAGGLLNWVIAGGESGPGWRRPYPDWFRSVRDQCDEWRIPFFFKQWGGTKKVNSVWGGNLLDDQVWAEYPYNPQFAEDQVAWE